MFLDIDYYKLTKFHLVNNEGRIARYFSDEKICCGPRAINFLGKNYTGGCGLSGDVQCRACKMLQVSVNKGRNAPIVKSWFMEAQVMCD